MHYRINHILQIFLILTCGTWLSASAQQMRRLTHSDGLPSSTVMSVLSAGNGFLWLGTTDGLSIYDGREIYPFETFSPENNLSGNLIHSINETPQAIWVQTNYGLDRLSKENAREMEEFSEFRDNYTYLSDSKDIIFSVGLANKIHYYVEGDSEEFRPLEGVTVSDSQYHYFTWRGDTLRIFEGDGIKSYLLDRKGNGDICIRKQLPSRNMEIERCFPDYDGKVWIVDRKGVIWLYDQYSGKGEKYADMRDDCARRGCICTVARRKGSDELFVGFQWNDVIKLHTHPGDTDHCEKTYLGIKSGIVRVEPDRNQEVMWIITDGVGVYEYIETQPTEAVVDYSPVHFTGITRDSEGVVHRLARTSDGAMKIMDDEQNFSVLLAAPDHINGRNYSFYQKLAGDENWLRVNDNRVNFSHLPYGSYQLLVHYTDPITAFTSPDYSLDISVNTPWYLSWWMKSIYIFLCVALVVSGVFYILWHRSERQKQHILAIKEEQDKDLFEKKLRFFTGIAHEFSAPLTLIYGSCERILEHAGIDDYTRRYVNTVRHNTESLNSLIQEIIDFGRIESGTMPRIVTLVDISLLCEDTLQMFSEVEERNSVKLESNVEMGVLWPTDMHGLKKILTNLLLNAFKYTPPYGTIRITVYVSRNVLVIRVYNTGKGIDDNDGVSIIDRHSILKTIEKNATKGFSSRNDLGMAACQAMVELLDGQLTVESEIGKYSEYVVKLPRLPLSPKIDVDIIADSMPMARPVG